MQSFAKTTPITFHARYYVFVFENVTIFHHGATLPLIKQVWTRMRRTLSRGRLFEIEQVAPQPAQTVAQYLAHSIV